MEVILQTKIGRLGNIGDKCIVKPGYGRYLIREAMALQATAANIAEFEARRDVLEREAAGVLKTAEQRGELFNKLDIVEISANASDEGKLFGSVGAREIADAINGVNTNIECTAKEVLLPEGPVRELGEFDIDLQIHSDLRVTVKINVVTA